MLEMPPSLAVDQLKEIIKRLRDEELEHKATAEENDSAQAPCHSVLSWVIQRGCRAAIFAVSKL
jgi:ubiquinone biosynthesis monooxygenase Coq7